MKTPIMIRVIRAINDFGGSVKPTTITLPPRMRDELKAESLRWSHSRGVIREDLHGSARRSFMFWGLQVRQSVNINGIQVG